MKFTNFTDTVNNVFLLPKHLELFLRTVPVQRSNSWKELFLGCKETKRAIPFSPLYYIGDSLCFSWTCSLLLNFSHNSENLKNRNHSNSARPTSKPQIKMSSSSIKSKRISPIRGGSEAQLPGKLHDMMTCVEEVGIDNIISWIRNGRAFMVHNH
jgi:hypothetical protein